VSVNLQPRVLVNVNITMWPVVSLVKICDLNFSDAGASTKATSAEISRSRGA